MHCNGSCKDYKAEANILEGGRYEQGQKRCHECELFIEWEGLWCPCCGHLLRTKPRATKPKRRRMLMNRKKEENY
jgi:rRNA maturation endonuclease Nob1